MLSNNDVLEIRSETSFDLSNSSDNESRMSKSLESVVMESE